MYRVIIPLDGSELSEHAIGVGVSLARALDGSIVLAHIAGNAPLPSSPSVDSTEDDRSLAYLKRVASSMPDDISVAVTVSRGHPADEIVAMASTGPRSLIVMSTHGRGGLGRFVFGSVADSVVRTATVPVVVVPAAQPATTVIRNLLVPLDGSVLAESVLPLATAIARGAGAALHIVRVVEPFWSDPSTAQGGAAAYFTGEQAATHDRYQAAQARSYLSSIAGDIADEGAHPVWSLRYGKPVAGIAAAAGDVGADLILMSSHGLGGLKRWAFGSVASDLVQRALAPVLILPSAAQSTGRNPHDTHAGALA